MRPVLLVLSLLITGSLAVLPSPASAGPGVGGGYEKTPKRKPMRRKRAGELVVVATATA